VLYGRCPSSAFSSCTPLPSTFWRLPLWTNPSCICGRRVSCASHDTHRLAGAPGGGGAVLKGIVCLPEAGCVLGEPNAVEDMSSMRGQGLQLSCLYPSTFSILEVAAVDKPNLQLVVQTTTGDHHLRGSPGATFVDNASVVWQHVRVPPPPGFSGV
jgi:hypothetical protein